jgi:hypothetical protein
MLKRPESLIRKIYQNGRKKNVIKSNAPEPIKEEEPEQQFKGRFKKKKFYK